METIAAAKFGAVVGSLCLGWMVSTYSLSTYPDCAFLEISIWGSLMEVRHVSELKVSFNWFLFKLEVRLRVFWLFICYFEFQPTSSSARLWCHFE
jgi:hypothetical protein